MFRARLTLLVFGGSHRVAADGPRGFNGDMDYEIRALYGTLLQSWDARDPAAYAALFAEHGSVVGCDGAEVNGRAAIEDHLRELFAVHRAGSCVHKVREVRRLGPDAALLRAVTGMVSPDRSDLVPDADAVQCLVAARAGTVTWHIELFQHTPATLSGNPGARDRLGAELRELLRGEE